MKKITLKIAGKIGLGYGILTIAIVLNAALVTRVIIKSRDLNSRISLVYEPSSFKLNQLSNLIEKSHMLIHSWVFVDKIANAPDKLQLVNIQDKLFPELEKVINIYADDWSDSLKIEYNIVRITIKDSLFFMQKEVMGKLKTLSDYDDPDIYFQIVPMVTDHGKITMVTENIIRYFQ